jgi:hypothetical protein
MEVAPLVLVYGGEGSRGKILILKNGMGIF